MPCNAQAPRLNLKPWSWGQPFWLVLYSIALTYPNTPSIADRTAARDLLRSLQYLLPCTKCRHNYAEKWTAWVQARLDGNALDCSDNFVRLIHDLETAVAATQNPPASVPSLAEVRRQVLAGKFLAAPVPETTTEGGGGGGNLAWLGAVVPLTVGITAVVTWAITRAVMHRSTTRTG